MSSSSFSLRTIEELIAEVKKRPILWNKNVENYNNRISMHAEWKELGKVLKKDQNLVKLKWRNLRDQFLRELKKTRIPDGCEDKPLINYYRGRWVYFQDLLFLKDYMTEKKKKSANNESGDGDEITYEEIKEELVFEEETEEPEENTLEDQSFVEPNVEVIVWPQNSDKKEQRETKRRRETDRLGQSKKVAVEIDEDKDIDEDLYFVKSLVPFLRKLNPIRKLVVRNEIQSLLIKEMLCDKCRINGPQKMCKCDGTS